MAAASFVAEVLATAGQVEKEDLNAKLGKLSKRIEDAKKEVYDALQKRYGDFYPNLNATLELASRVRNLSDDMQNVTERIEREIKNQMNLSTSEFQELSAQLQESNGILAVLDKLVGIHDALEMANRNMKNKDFVTAAKNLEDIQDLAARPVHQRENEIKILTSLQTEYRVQKEKLIFDLGENWNSNVCWSLPKDDKAFPDRVELKIDTAGEKDNILQNMTQAMFNVNILDQKLKLFGQRFLKYIVKPISRERNIEVSFSAKQGGGELLSVCNNRSLQIPTPTEVYQKLRLVFDILNKYLLSVKIEESEEKKITLMQKLGKLISKELLDILVKECLSHAIPTSKAELEKYTGDVVPITEEFQKELVSLHLIDSSCNVLVEYVNNVNVLFANKKCQEILERARKLMTSEIHNTVEIKVDDPVGTLPKLGEGESDTKKTKKIENVSLASQQQLSSNTFRLPACHISESVQTLMQLAYETLHEATSSTPQCGIQLFYSVRNIFELFCTVVPTYHRDSLAKLPQLAALHHNNCMYIAHHLMTMGHQFQQQQAEPLNKGAASFVDLVPKLRRLGTECLLDQMSSQKAELLELLGGAQGFISVSEGENQVQAERSIKQVLHQLHHLRNVWEEVLPINIYYKAIGTLLNSVIVKIMNDVVVLEDISADDGVELHSLFSLVTEKAPELFKTSDTVNADVELISHVAKWLKFKELILILNASLQDIADRWAEGKGPLAHEFSPNEAKQLIRALFQNTDRRSAVLAKIR